MHNEAACVYFLFLFILPLIILSAICTPKTKKGLILVMVLINLGSECEYSVLQLGPTQFVIGESRIKCDLVTLTI